MTDDEYRETIGSEQIWEKALKDLPYQTDSLSIGQLRKTFPNDFTWQFSSKRNECVESLLGAVQTERELALVSACNHMCVPYTPPCSYELDRNELVDALARNYVALGLAAGEHAAKELARNVERSSVEAVELQFKGWQRR